MGQTGWSRGSAFFIETLRAQGVTLRGTGADFGCGYGYLSRAILNDFEKEGGTSKAHSPKSQTFFRKIKEVWEDLT